MRFHLNEEQVAIRDAVRGALAGTWPVKRLHRFADDDADFDAESWQAMASVGLSGIWSLTVSC